MTNNNIKEKIITLIIGTAAVSVVIGVVSFFNFLLRMPDKKSPEQIIQPDF